MCDIPVRKVSRSCMVQINHCRGEAIQTVTHCCLTYHGSSGSGNSPDWIAVANPPASALHTAVLDELNDRMVVFGGHGYSGLMNDVWTMSHDYWSGQVRWSRAGAEGPVPDPRRAHGAAYDPSRGAMYIFGGDA